MAWASAKARKRRANCRLTQASGHRPAYRPVSKVVRSSDGSHATRTPRMPNRVISSGSMRADCRQHLDVLVAVQVCRPQPVSRARNRFGAPVPLGWPREPALPTPEPETAPSYAGKATAGIEQLARITSQRTALGQVQMDAQVERPPAVVESPPDRHRRQRPGGVLLDEDLPSLERSPGVRGVDQHRGTRQQAVLKAPQDAVRDGPAHPEVIGVKHQAAGHLQRGAVVRIPVYSAALRVPPEEGGTRSVPDTDKSIYAATFAWSSGG